MNSTKLLAERNQNISYNRNTVLRLGDSMPFREAAQKLGLGVKDFTALYRNFGGKRRGGISRRTPPEKKELVNCLKNMSNREVAEHYKVSYKTLVRWLKLYNLNEHLFSNDMLSLADTARVLNVSRMTVSNWYRNGEIPGAVKLNETRVMVPRATVNMLLLLRGQTS